MSYQELNELLAALGRTPGIFYRDTGLLLQTLNNIKAVQGRFRELGYNSIEYEKTDKEAS